MQFILLWCRRAPADTEAPPDMHVFEMWEDTEEYLQTECSRYISINSHFQVHVNAVMQWLTLMILQDAPFS